jgi:hypothetical protein
MTEINKTNYNLPKVAVINDLLASWGITWIPKLIVDNYTLSTYMYSANIVFILDGFKYIKIDMCSPLQVTNANKSPKKYCSYFYHTKNNKSEFSTDILGGGELIKIIVSPYWDPTVERRDRIELNDEQIEKLLSACEIDITYNTRSQ